MINLDPAVYNLPYTPDIDIRKTVDYKKTMKEHKLGFKTYLDQMVQLWLVWIYSQLNSIKYFNKLIKRKKKISNNPRFD